MSNIPLVSICCLVYNHELYLRECINGFLIQKTNFPVEILIHDDASTDNSVNIIKEYVSQYPDLFQPIYQQENQYSKGIRINTTYQFSRAKGKYIALCEGDDYWVDPYKLQKQIDFLEKNPSYSACAHKHGTLYDNNEIFIKEVFEEENKNINDILNANWDFHTATIVFRTDIIKNNLSQISIFSGDLWLFLQFALNGKIKVLGETMSVYRKHGTGVSASVTIERIKKDFNIIKNLLPLYPSFPVNAVKAYLNYEIIAHVVNIKYRELLFHYFSTLFYINRSEIDSSFLKIQTQNILAYKSPGLLRRVFRKMHLLNRNESTK